LIILLPVFLIMENKRISKRVDRNVPVKLQVVGPVLDKYEQTKYLMSKNICAGGIFLVTKDSFPQGADVILEIALPADNNANLDSKSHYFVKIKGTVLRLEKTGIALSFTKNFQIDFGDIPEYFLHDPLFEKHLLNDN
jgi:hypothetical protein